MDIDRAKEILTALADGINPVTGELLSEEDSCNQVEIVRAFHAIIMELENKHIKRKSSKYVNSGKQWSEEEDEQLIAEFRGGLKVREIAELHGRSNFAITSRLVKKGEVLE